VSGSEFVTVDAHRRPDLLMDYKENPSSNRLENGISLAEALDNKKIGERSGVAMNTLRMRAQRLREHLQGCVEECVGPA
jgi:hypothetical protein